ncbi:Heat-labile enterotoxin IIA, A chain [Metarhizium album ARSEF 1941]|uniref:Heat-labile enterotoxin IIA, A chain n=1 Tax=Metarhizium album (strain ARSEF 1941) TaxID=1081103 RepID=A0A0B2WQT3_METAS|nr:Heat-labile enterotoxin IIA, A chain [Metarhizium album ARSEF 1941]KHN98421.1 Heat-labile enterotoxin IIA, A chain [Metarhizium album ARSEF 1941]
MRIKILPLLVVVGLANAVPGIRRAPPPIQPSDPPSKQLWDSVVGGFREWGLNGDLQPPPNRNAPLKEMPFGLGLPKPRQRKIPAGSIVRVGVTRAQGQPSGRQTCSKPCWRKRQLCCDLGELGKPTKPKNPGSKPDRGSKVRVNKAAVARTAAIAVLTPLAKALLNELQRWDNVVGRAVRWFEATVASIQRAIGGSPRHDIDGSDLKAAFLCALKGGRAEDNIFGRKNKLCTPMEDEFKDSLQAKFREGKIDELMTLCRNAGTYRGGDVHVWNWSRRYCDAFYRTDEYAQRIWEMGLDGLVDSCSELEVNPPGDQRLRANLEARCTEFLQGLTDA